MLTKKIKYMKSQIKLILGFLFMLIIAPCLLMAQQDKKVEKKIVEKEKVQKDEKKEVREIIIRKNGDKEEKFTIEIEGDNVKINGKPLKDFKDEDINISMNKFRDFDNLKMFAPRGSMSFNKGENDFVFFGENDNKALLGVSTEKSETEGVSVKEVVKESAAEKAGLKEGDIITKVDDVKISNPEDLSKKISEHKPGDKVVITVKRDKKEQKINAELGKWKGMNLNNLELFSEGMPKMKMMEEMMPYAPRVPRTPNAPRAEFWMMDSKPKLGMSVQDSDDGKSIKVVDVDAEGNAGKAGLKKDDLITHINDKEVKSAEDLVKIVKETKDGNSLMIKLLRNGKLQNFEVKIPKKHKVVEL
jgi:serine protease Do